eukprot:764089-Hanusia_phi.AAC.2
MVGPDQISTFTRQISLARKKLTIRVKRVKWVPIHPTEQPHGSMITTVTLTAAALEVSPQGETIVHKHSRGQYYEESNIQKNNEKIKKWNKRAGDVNEALHTLSLVSSKNCVH